ncbi:MAG: RsfS/YbeB/iojap family protein [Acidimicrobiales bacterium]
MLRCPSKRGNSRRAGHLRSLRRGQRAQHAPGAHGHGGGGEADRQAGGPKPLRIEGLDDRTWVLMDYGDFVVHVFLQETREYYELERLWSDVPRVPWAEHEVVEAGSRS